MLPGGWCQDDARRKEDTIFFYFSIFVAASRRENFPDHSEGANITWLGTVSLTLGANGGLRALESGVSTRPLGGPLPVSSPGISSTLWVPD